MQSGVVYILSNEAFLKNLLKVGMTTLSASERARQISKHAGVPKDFKEIWSIKVPNIALAEKTLHHFLHKYAYGKEFFMLEPKLAIEICTEAMDRLFSPLDERKLKMSAAGVKEKRKKTNVPDWTLNQKAGFATASDLGKLIETIEKSLKLHEAV